MSQRPFLRNTAPCSDATVTILTRAGWPCLHSLPAMTPLGNREARHCPKPLTTVSRFTCRPQTLLDYHSTATQVVSKFTSCIHRNSDVSSRRRPGMCLQPETVYASRLCPGTHPGHNKRQRQGHIARLTKTLMGRLMERRQRWWIWTASGNPHDGLLRGVPWLSPPLAMTHDSC